jgi:hypothetical protein
VGNAPQILMSPEVRRLLGADGAARVNEIPLGDGHCPVCRQSLPPAGPVTVLLVCSATVTNAAFAHPDCMASTVIPAPDDAATRDEMDMTMTAVMLEHHGAMLPTLLAELPGAAYVAQGPAGAFGDLTNLLVSASLESGFALVTRLGAAPGPAPGWSATLEPAAAGLAGLHVREPGGGSLYIGTVRPPERWPAAVERYGWCVLYTGAFRLTDRSPAGVLRTLHSAAAAGGLTGARIPVRWQP